jgi:hypothetical protein
MGQKSTASLTTNPKGTHHAHSSLAPWNTDSADYPDYAVAPLRFEGASKSESHAMVPVH